MSHPSTFRFRNRVTSRPSTYQILKLFSGVENPGFPPSHRSSSPIKIPQSRHVVINIECGGDVEFPITRHFDTRRSCNAKRAVR